MQSIEEPETTENTIIIIKYITYTAASKKAQRKYLAKPEIHTRVNENKKLHMRNLRLNNPEYREQENKKTRERRLKNKLDTLGKM